MKKIILMVATLVALTTTAQAEYVSGYYKSNGTYVKGYHRSNANHTVSDNYSTYGNTNPYTGSRGNKKYDNTFENRFNNYNVIRVR